MEGITIIEKWQSGNKIFAALQKKKNKIGELLLTRTSRIDNIDLSAYGADLFPINKIFYIEYLTVDMEYRGLGIGKNLLQKCTKWADITKNVLILDAIPLDEFTKQKKLIKFYTGCGFKIPVEFLTGKRQHTGMVYHTRKIKGKTP